MSRSQRKYSIQDVSRNEMEKEIISNEIVEIAKKVLPSEKLQYVEYLCIQYKNKKKQRHVKKQLWALLSDQTPQGVINVKAIDYAKYDLSHLSNKTRDIVERASASIEQLCYFLLVENGGKHPSHDPLGRILNELENRNVLDTEFVSILRRFNRHIFVPAKHDYKINPNKQHLFSVEETIFILYIVTSLSRKLWPYFRKHALDCNEIDWK